MVTIEVLYFEGCPNLEPTVELARRVAQELGVEAELRLVEVRDQDAAERLSFLGSPSVRIDGADIDAGADADTGAGYALSCRMYGDAGVPPEELLVNALKSRA